jgi:hypothetical protein
VLAIDADHATVELTYAALVDRPPPAGSVTPILGDLLNPSADVGWANEEREALTRRTNADLVLALALIHHLAVQGEVPLERVLAWLGRHGRILALEWVPPDDPKVAEMLSTRRERVRGYSGSAFEQAIGSIGRTIEVVSLTASGLASSRRDIEVIRRVPVHPPLWAAWPVLVLWGENWRLVTAGEVVPTLLAVSLLSLFIWAVFALAGAGVRGGAVAASILAFATQYAALVPGPPAVAVALIVALTVLLGWLLRRIRAERLGQTTLVFNITGAVVVSVALVPVVLGWLRAPDALSLAAPILSEASREAQRDVLYVIPDRMGRVDVLRDDYDWDAAPFVDALEDRGFQVAPRSAANYPKTAHSLASAWNLQYLDEIAADIPASAASDLRLLYPLLETNHLGATARELGYDYIHLGSWWAATARASHAKQNLTRTGVSQFGKVHLDRTLVPSLARVVPFFDYEDFRWYARRHVEYGLETLGQLAEESESRPRFIVAHLTIPHEPYVFEGDGGWVPQQVERSRSEKENYRRHLDFAERSLLEVFDRWLDRPPAEQPIIVLQPDEGPHPEGLRADPELFRWVDAPEDQQREKLAILTAVYLPGSDLRLPSELTPVNTFRLLFDEYHGTELGLLDDRSFVYTSEVDLYEFMEVTANIS